MAFASARSNFLMSKRRNSSRSASSAARVFAETGLKVPRFFFGTEGF